MMYVARPERRQVMREAYRVLRPGGEFLLWDVTIPRRSDPVPWVNHDQDARSYVRPARECGLSVDDPVRCGEVFCSRASKDERARTTQSQ